MGPLVQAAAQAHGNVLLFAGALEREARGSVLEAALSLPFEASDFGSGTDSDRPAAEYVE